MLPRTARIGTQGLKEVISTGKSLRTIFLSIKYLSSGESLQCAVVVSKKVAKGAVERNCIRRAVYRALAVHKSGKGGKMVVFVQKTPKGPLEPAFTEDLASVWGKVADKN